MPTFFFLHTLELPHPILKYSAALQCLRNSSWVLSPSVVNGLRQPTALVLSMVLKLLTSPERFFFKKNYSLGLKISVPPNQHANWSHPKIVIFPSTDLNLLFHTHLVEDKSLLVFLKVHVKWLKLWSVVNNLRYDNPKFPAFFIKSSASRPWIPRCFYIYCIPTNALPSKAPQGHATICAPSCLCDLSLSLQQRDCFRGG